MQLLLLHLPVLGLLPALWIGKLNSNIIYIQQVLISNQLLSKNSLEPVEIVHNKHLLM